MCHRSVAVCPAVLYFSPSLSFSLSHFLCPPNLCTYLHVLVRIFMLIPVVPKLLCSSLVHSTGYSGRLWKVYTQTLAFSGWCQYLLCLQSWTKPDSTSLTLTLAFLPLHFHPPFLAQSWYHSYVISSLEPFICMKPFSLFMMIFELPT